MKVGIEIGGTFTDLILVEDGGGTRTHKVPSTPGDPTMGAIAGLRELLSDAGHTGQEIDELLHGSTIATNALIERKGARVGLVTTAGFEDVMAIGRQERDEVNDIFYQRPPPLIRARDIRGVTERLDADGEVVLALDLDDAGAALQHLVEERGTTSVAVSFLHAYRDPAHERAVAALAAERYPDLPVSLSSDIAPEHREYERTSTTVLSAYVHPVVGRYVETFQSELAALGFGGTPLIMQSNGGVLPAPAAATLPAGMYLSGPAAGVTGAAFIARERDLPNLITMDVGGTSCDVSLITDGRPQMTARGFAEYKVHGHPINLVMMDIFALGAGGGSIAWADEGGMLRVGPESAGADPGPACYGQGGPDFTLTDAFLLLGLLSPDHFLGGAMTLDAAASERAAGALGVRFGMTAAELARSVHRIAVSNVAQGLRLNTVQRGRDPRDYAICAYGGAGPLLAASVAEEMGIARVVVPPHPGVFSAFGLSAADMRMDFVQSMPGPTTDALADGELAAVFDVLRARATAEFMGLSATADTLQFAHMVDARYAGQGYELRVSLDDGAITGDAAASGFHAAHARQYGHGFADRAVQIVNCRLVAVRPRGVTIAPPAAPADAAGPTRRQVRLDGREGNWPIHDRDALEADARIEGPAIIEEGTSATLVAAGWSCTRDEHGILHLERRGHHAV